ncbi:hypothetical protein [Marinomonas sp. 2405UD68-3]|uniref:hypothetical protein n=1 Tax=Marinomonas sp. 2405UD68-3 TaxID=3391835 RepID=UPI0039C99F90
MRVACSGALAAILFTSTNIGAVTIKFSPKGVTPSETIFESDGRSIEKAMETAGEWFLDDRYTLRENVNKWAEIAKIQTGKDIRVIWDAPGPGVFQIPYHFDGTWYEAFLALGESAQTSNWPIKISVNTRMNSIVITQIQN